MASKIKVDTIENVAGSGNVSLGSGHNLVVPGDLTVDTSTLKVDATNNRVGIGTASPTTRLSIGDGTTNSENVMTLGKRVTSAQSNLPVIGHTSHDGTASDLGICATSTAGSVILYTGNNAAGFGTGSNAERLRIDSSGNVQLGSASSVTGGRYFDIYNTGSTATDFSILRFITQQVGSSSTVSGEIYKRKNGQFTITNGETNSAAFTSFQVGASERMRIDSSGNVGIGTSSPAATSSTYKNLQVAVGATVIGRTDDTPLYLSSNLSYNSGWKYIANTQQHRLH